ncbi:MAG: radical SAM family heme chaperone HemW [Actinomycetes bacterium]
MAPVAASSDLSFYIHIPYCVKRCGYCDFNTYTPAELKVESSLTEISHSYIDLMMKEIEMARAFSDARTVPTIFFGGGTPSLMEPADLGRVIATIADHFELSSDCEITMEANPDTLTLERLKGYREAGINRLSIGMQSAVSHVLHVLDRTHNPANIEKVVGWAREAGFDEISLDLIYGTPGETMDDWQASIEAALSQDISHISAYALIVEDGTKLAAQVRRGEFIIPEDDETADKYLLADQRFHEAGFEWYEISNWSKPGSSCRHNVAYWKGANWWGIGPGAHSHINGRRWWNVKHPTAYRERIKEGHAPMQANEVLTEEEMAREEIMLLLRLPAGLSLDSFNPAQRTALEDFAAQGYFEQDPWEQGLLTLSRSGRLIADRIVRELVL